MDHTDGGMCRPREHVSTTLVPGLFYLSSTHKIVVNSFNALF